MGETGEGGDTKRGAVWRGRGSWFGVTGEGEEWGGEGKGGGWVFGSGIGFASRPV